MNASRAAGRYARVGVESRVIAADSHQLIMLLLDGAVSAIRTAGLHLQQNNISAKGEYVSKALDIVNRGLLASLDQERGGQVAEHLAALYNYIARLLLAGNFHNDGAKLDEAVRLLENIGSAWRGIAHSTMEG